MQVELTRAEIHAICSALARLVENNPKTDFDKTVKTLYLKLGALVTGDA